MHDGLGRTAEHLVNSKVKRAHPVRLFKSETSVTGRFSYYIHRCTFPRRYLLYMLQRLVLDEQAHAFLGLVGDYLFCREGVVTDWELVHVYETAAFLHQFRQAVDMTCRTMVMD